MLIGAGEQHKGLYFLKGVDPIHAYKTTSIASYELWHRRMGHHLFYWMVRHHMRSYTNKPPPISTFELLHKDKFASRAENVFLLDIHLERKIMRARICKNDMEEQQASVSDVEHKIDVEMGHNMEMATDGNTEVGDRGAPTCQDLWFVTTGCEPSTYVEAIKDECWREAMRKEIQTLEDNETWTVEDLPPEKKAIRSKWVYKIKYNFDGSIERCKARLVILGNKQVEGIDYNETFAPTAKMVTV
ncbi:hypothetical protein AAG906_020973 [Vitis piasezkii]